MKRKKLLMILAVLLTSVISISTLASCDMSFLDALETLEIDESAGGNVEVTPGKPEGDHGQPDINPSQPTERPDVDSTERPIEAPTERPDADSTECPIEAPTERPNVEYTEQTTEKVTEVVPETTTEAKPPVEEEVFPEHITQKNYGRQFYLSILPDTNPIYYYWVEKSEGGAMSEAVYARQERIRRYLGVEIIGKSAGNFSTYVTPFKTAVKNQDGSVDTLMTHVNQGVAGFISEQYVRNFGDYPGIDLERDYWNTDIMSTLAIEDQYYLGYSDFNIPYTHVVAFNKTMMEAYAGNLDKTPYQMVEDYEWTLGTMLDIAKLVSIDKTGDGKTEDDTFGLTGQQWVPWIGFFHACDINLVEMNEKGSYVISIMNTKNKEKTANLVSKLKEFSDSEYGHFTYPPSTGGVPAPISLTTGRTLMQLTSTYSLNSFLNYNVTFGVLPYPMYDTNQKDVGYRSLQWGGYLCIPAYVNNPQMVGETLELLAFDSKDVRRAFYEKQLGKQVAEVPEDRKMLDIVWASVCTDMGQAYGDECPGITYFLPQVTRTESEKMLVSYLASFERTSNTKLARFIKRVMQNINNSQ